jgi:hypothetical protein
VSSFRKIDLEDDDDKNEILGLAVDILVDSGSVFIASG